MEDLNVIVEGTGPTVVFVHGSAADHTTWGIQRMTLKPELRMVVYDRRGTGATAEQSDVLIPHHVADLRRVIEAQPGQVTGCGSSFGAVVLLELLRDPPKNLNGAV